MGNAANINTPRQSLRALLHHASPTNDLGVKAASACWKGSKYDSTFASGGFKHMSGSDWPMGNNAASTIDLSGMESRI